MIDPAHDPQEEFAETREHEYLNPHYHDEDPDIVDDEEPIRHTGVAPIEKKKATRPPPKQRHYED
jgi:hypothetical protein